MEMGMWVNWLHLVVVVIWMGGLSFLLWVLLPQDVNPQTQLPEAHFVKSAKRFHPYTWAAMALVVLTGVFRVQLMGGMHYVPPVIHAKIGIAMLMILVGLLNSFYMLPKLEEKLLVSSPENDRDAKALFKGYVMLSSLIVGLGFIILFLLAQSKLI